MTKNTEIRNIIIFNVIGLIIIVTVFGFIVGWQNGQAIAGGLGTASVFWIANIVRSIKKINLKYKNYKVEPIIVKKREEGLLFNE